MLRLLALSLALAAPAAAQDESVLAGLSTSRIAIDATFAGTEILIYGAVKRDAAPAPGDAAAEPLGVIVTVAGPSTPVVVRRKSRLAGIWVNSAAVTVDAAPSFYAVAASGPLAQVLSETSDLRHRITIPRAIRSVGAPMDVPDAASFTDAVIRIRTATGLYQTMPGAVALRQDTLFSTTVALPANLVEGNYTTRIFLTRAGLVVNDTQTVIFVQKVGLERFLWVLAHERPAIYGLLSLAIAAAAGWGASAAFRLVRG